MRSKGAHLRTVVSPICDTCLQHGLAGRIARTGKAASCSSAKQDQPEGDGAMVIKSIDQKRIGKDDFRAAGEVEVRYQDRTTEGR